jgi:hypothetical protein
MIALDGGVTIQELAQKHKRTLGSDMGRYLRRGRATSVIKLPAISFTLIHLLIAFRASNIF